MPRNSHGPRLDTAAFVIVGQTKPLGRRMTSSAGEPYAAVMPAAIDGKPSGWAYVGERGSGARVFSQRLRESPGRCFCELPGCYQPVLLRVPGYYGSDCLRVCFPGRPAPVRCCMR